MDNTEHNPEIRLSGYEFLYRQDRFYQTNMRLNARKKSWTNKNVFVFLQNFGEM